MEEKEMGIIINTEKINKEKILEALNMIKHICETTECYECPFRATYYNSCTFVQSPEPPYNWKINTDNKWKAFADEKQNEK